MEIQVNDDCKCVEIWLSQAERGDRALHDRLETFCQPYRVRNYLIAVFLSGTEPLYEETRELLRSCRRRQAEQEARDRGQSA